MTPEQINITVFIAIAFAIGMTIGYLIALLKANKLKNELLTERKLHEQKLAALEEASQNMANNFANLSNEALKQNNEIFIKLAEENLKKHQLQAQSELEKKEKNIENILKPIKETLSKTESQLREMEKERKQAYGSLSQHLAGMAESQNRLQMETQNLVTALRRPEVRGQWGEITLKRLAELAGMIEHCDFYEQESVNSENGVLRPDMIVRMPDNRELIIDAKTPLDAYLSAVQSNDDNTKQTELARHARKVKDRIKELASKAYWSQFKNSPDYVVLFIPGEQFLSAALEIDSNLLEYALQNKVILATPTSLIALLRAVAFGWRQQAVAENAEAIQKLGEDLHSRMVSFTEHLSKAGQSLGNSVEHYNKAVGSLERNVLPGARKFVELGIENKKTINTLEPLDNNPRKLEK